MPFFAILELFGAAALARYWCQCCGLTSSRAGACRHSHSMAPGESQQAAPQRPFQYTGRRQAPVILCNFRSPGQPWDQLPWQAAADKLSGKEDGRMIPSWLSDALLQGRLPNCKESKAGFHLMPAQVTASIDQLIDQSTNQSIKHQPINSTTHPSRIKHQASIHQSLHPSMHQSTHQSFNS